MSVPFAVLTTVASKPHRVNAIGFKQGGGTDGAQRSPLPYGGDIHSGNGCGEVFLELKWARQRL